MSLEVSPTPVPTGYLPTGVEIGSGQQNAGRPLLGEAGEAGEVKEREEGAGSFLGELSWHRHSFYLLLPLSSCLGCVGRGSHLATRRASSRELGS